MLKEWASGEDVYVAGFFFWNSVTKEQRSHKGLMKSLLFQCLNWKPALVPHVIPSKWKLKASTSEYEWLETITSNWSLKKLEESFQLMTSQTSIQMKMCFFIDGLDEYDGDHAELARLFRDIADRHNSNIKFCVSSRPWLVFEDAFQDVPSLQLQDLTRSDIERYVNDKFASNRRWRDLAEQEPAISSGIIEEIVEKSSGVFLWVFLVVRSLLEGLVNHDDDNMSDLQMRLHLLPADLEHLYKHMLLRIEPAFYKEQASQIFQIVRKAQESREYLKKDEDEKTYPLTVIELALAFGDDQHLVPGSLQKDLSGI
jgi:hypothetical protein